MAAALAQHAVRHRDLLPLRVVRLYRSLRERAGDENVADYEEHVVRSVARHLDLEPGTVSDIVAEWINRRPLPYLLGCRYPVVDRLFERIRQSGRKLGILSDYAATDKVAALGLSADYIVSAGDVGALKPNPVGLLRVMEMAGETPDTTVLIGDRADRDGAVAQRVGVRCFLRGSQKVPDFTSFDAFDAPLFHGLLQPNSR